MCLLTKDKIEIHFRLEDKILQGIAINFWNYRTILSSFYNVDCCFDLFSKILSDQFQYRKVIVCWISLSGNPYYSRSKFNIITEIEPLLIADWSQTSKIEIISNGNLNLEILNITVIIMCTPYIMLLGVVFANSTVSGDYTTVLL